MNHRNTTEERSTTEREAELWYERLDTDNLRDKVWKEFVEWQTIPAHQEAFDATASRRELMFVAQARTSAAFSPLYRRHFACSLALIAVVVGVHLALIVAVFHVDSATQPFVIFTGERGGGWLLEDGSLLRAGPDTLVEVEFDDQRRSIYLIQGSAFFRVAPVANRPFVVRTDHAEVEAHGTAFGVSLIERNAEVTVMEGTVAVSPNAASYARFDLHANEQARVSPTHAERVVSKDVTNTLMWATTIQFDNRPAVEAVAEFTRLSGIPLQLNASLPASEAPVAGIFQFDDPVAFAQEVANRTSATVRVFLRPELPQVVVQPASPAQ